MSEKPKLEVVSEQLKAEGNPASVFDDLASLRKASKLTVQRKAVLVNVAVDKPPNNSYFRCHRELVLDDATVLRDTEGTSRAFYFVVPRMRTHPKLAPRLRKVTLVLTCYLAERQCPDLAGAHPHRARVSGLEICAERLTSWHGTNGCRWSGPRTAATTWSRSPRASTTNRHGPRRISGSC